MDLSNLPKSTGTKHLKRYQLGERLTQRQAILAKCSDCMGYYVDGRLDCEMADCPLYPFMPYTIKPKKSRKGSSDMSQKQKQGETESFPDEFEATP